MSKRVLISLSVLVIIVCAFVIATESAFNNAAGKESTAVSVSQSSMENEAVQSKTGSKAEKTSAGTQESASAAAEKATAAAGKSTAQSASSGVYITDSSTAGSTSAAAKTKTTAKSTTAGTAAAAQKTTAQNSTTAKSTAKKTTTQENTASKSTSSTEKESFDVTISISCKNALPYIPTLPQNGYFLTKTTCTVKNGDTVFDLLKAVCSENSISLTYKSAYYIQGIGNLNEKDCTASSGWMYRVNGAAPKKAACNYTLAEGDSVEWYYVTSSSDR